MRRGKFDPLVLIVIGAIVCPLLMVTCYRTFSKTFMPSIALTAEATQHFGKAVNISDRGGRVTAMVLDTTGTVDSAASVALSNDVATWIIRNRVDTVALSRLSVSVQRTQAGSIVPEQLHQLSLDASQIDSARKAAGGGSPRRPAGDSVR